MIPCVLHLEMASFWDFYKKHIGINALFIYLVNGTALSIEVMFTIYEKSTFLQTVSCYTSGQHLKDNY